MPIVVDFARMLRTQTCCGVVRRPTRVYYVTLLVETERVLHPREANTTLDL